MGSTGIISTKGEVIVPCMFISSTEQLHYSDSSSLAAEVELSGIGKSIKFHSNFTEIKITIQAIQTSILEEELHVNKKVGCIISMKEFMCRSFIDTEIHDFITEAVIVIEVSIAGKM